MAKKPQPVPKSFEEAEQELNEILAHIEGGQSTLEDSLAKYERGMFLLQYCRSVLDRAEKQIEELTRQNDGTLSAEPLEQPE
jgi:exodeoxyribonuclease VII small subunit